MPAPASPRSLRELPPSYLANRGVFEAISRLLPIEWLEEAFAATGTATIRKRRLPAERVVWLVIGMALFRDLAIDWLVHQMGIALPASSGAPVAASGIAQARARVGSSPLRWLFERSAREWAAPRADLRWRGLEVYGVDGTAIRVPDSEPNRGHFGGRANDRGDSGYPLLRAVTVMQVRTHILAAASIGPYTDSELSFAREIWSQIPDGALAVVDRGLFYAELLVPLMRRNGHFLTRMRKNSSYEVVEKLGPGDEIIEMPTSWISRQHDESLPKTWRARAIRYHRRGFRPQRLVTSLTDAKKWPRDEIVALYHERWELELGYNEVKRVMLEREETIRSQTPSGVLQEIWGLFIAYNIVRLEMAEAAKKHKIRPTELSFIASYRHIRAALTMFATMSPGTLPKRLEDLDDDLALYVLPERRRARRYPRAVKIKMSHYDRKRPKSERRLNRRLK